MEPKGLLPHSKAPATCPYSAPVQYSPCLAITLLEDPFYSFMFKPCIDMTSLNNKQLMHSQWVKYQLWCNNSSVYFTYRLAVHVLGVTSTHHQERQECAGRYGTIVGSVCRLCAVLAKIG